MTHARYIVFEGGEGSGKSTQARRLARRIGARLTFEPGATRVGAELRSILLDPDRGPIDSRAETLLMAADRAQHLVEVVEPELASGRHVVSDRSLYSSLAYQGGGRGLGVDAVGAINDWAISGRHPDLVVFLDIDPGSAGHRLSRSLDRLEREGAAFHRSVHDTYVALAGADPDRWFVIDATPESDVVEAAVWAIIEPRL